MEMLRHFHPLFVSCKIKYGQSHIGFARLLCGVVYYFA